MLSIDEVHEILNDNLIAFPLNDSSSIKVIMQDDLSKIAKQIVDSQKGE